MILFVESVSFFKSCFFFLVAVDVEERKVYRLVFVYMLVFVQFLLLLLSCFFFLFLFSHLNSSACSQITYDNMNVLLLIRCPTNFMVNFFPGKLALDSGCERHSEQNRIILFEWRGIISKSFFFTCSKCLEN